MAPDAPKAPLQTIGQYDVMEKIADGGMGSVFKALNRETGEVVALKVVAPHMASNQVLLKRFEQEYNAAKQLDHPNIVRALDYGDSGSAPYLVMEFVDGESLGQRLQRESRIPEKEAIRLIAQVAQGLYRAHKEKLIHRDVKPDNILITRDGQAKLTDLGLVKEVETDLNLTRTGRGLGTPHFMAPEQFKNAKNADPRCDIYSLGATLYMMVTGEMPFQSSGPLDAYMKKVDNKFPPPREIVPTLSERIDWAIRRAMSADPELRPASCREFVEDLTGRSTRKVTAPGQPTAAQQDVWFLVYRDDENQAHTLKGTTPGIRRSLKEGLLGDASNVRASRSKTGPFEPLRGFPEFRDLVIMPGVATPAPGQPARPVSAAVRNKKANAEIDLGPTVAAPAVAGQRALAPAPQIDLEAGKRASGNWPPWVQWLLLLLVLAASAVVGFFVIPK
jgi:serine/threonine protein kinase